MIVNSAVFAAKQRAKVPKTASANSGLRRSSRRPQRTSCSTVSARAPARASRTLSFTLSTPPRSSLAARRAARGSAPARTCSSTSRSNVARSSASSSRSTRSRCARFRQRLDRREMKGTLRSEGARDRDRDPVPLRRFFPELLPPRLREAVVFRPAIVLRPLPARLEPAGLLQSMQRREERTGLHHERPLSDLRNPARDAEPVQLACRQGLEDEEI